jgi:hypothetical protein
MLRACLSMACHPSSSSSILGGGSSKIKLVLSPFIFLLNLLALLPISFAPLKATGCKSSSSISLTILSNLTLSDLVGVPLPRTLVSGVLLTTPYSTSHHHRIRYSIGQGCPCPLLTLNPFGRELLLSDVLARIKRSTRIVSEAQEKGERAG